MFSFLFVLHVPLLKADIRTSNNHHMMQKQYSIDQDEEEDNDGFLKAADSYEYIALDAEDHIVDMDDYIFNGMNDNNLEHGNHTDNDDNSIDGGDDDSIGSDGDGDRDDDEYDDAAAAEDDDDSIGRNW